MPTAILSSNIIGNATNQRKIAPTAPYPGDFLSMYSNISLAPILTTQIRLATTNADRINNNRLITKFTNTNSILHNHYSQA